MPEQRKITPAIMKEWGPYKVLRTLGAPHHRGSVMHKLQSTQTIPCISRTVIGQSGHSLLQESMPDDEELDCVASKRKVLNWTPLAWLNSLAKFTGAFGRTQTSTRSPATSRAKRANLATRVGSS
jgi:hypothetical protein